MVRCFDGGGLGLFLSNTLGNKHTKIEGGYYKKESQKFERTRIRLFVLFDVPIYAS